MSCIKNQIKACVAKEFRGIRWYHGEAWEVKILLILFLTLASIDALSLVEAAISYQIQQAGGKPRFGYFNSLPSIEKFYKNPNHSFIHSLFGACYTLGFLAIALGASRLQSAFRRGFSVAIIGVIASFSSQLLFIGLGVISSAFGLLLSLCTGAIIATERLNLVVSDIGKARLFGESSGIEFFKFKWDILKFFASAILKSLVGLGAVIATGFTILWGLGWGLEETKWLGVRIFVGVCGLLLLIGWGLVLPLWQAFQTLCQQTSPKQNDEVA